MSANDPLTKKELEFRAIIAGVDNGRGRVEINPRYAVWCAAARAAWAIEHAAHVATVMDKRFR